MRCSKGLFIEAGHDIAPKTLSERVYTDAMSSLIIVCTDAAIICPERKTLYLAERIVCPMRGYWTIGGRRFAGEAGVEAACRNLLRETGVNAEERRFAFATQVEVIWSQRREEPPHHGRHDLIQFFSIVLSTSELQTASKNLLHTEYAPMSLRPFTLKELIDTGANPIMQHLHQALFREN